MKKTDHLSKTAVILVATAGLFTVLIPIIAWRGEKAPEFYGALVAALIAAASLILVARYENQLARQRDERLRAEERAAEAIDLLFWLDHFVYELQFIATVLEQMKASLINGDKERVELPFEQFREVISSHFFDELLARAKIASRLPTEISGIVTRDIYDTFTASDRIFKLRGASSNFHPSLKEIENYLTVLTRRSERLQTSAALIENHLKASGKLND